MKYTFSVVAAIILATGAWAAEPPSVDLAKASVVIGKSVVPLPKALEMLQQEVAARAGVTLPQAESLATATGTAVAIGTVGNLPDGMPKLPQGLAVPEKAEGYALWVDTATRKAPTVCLVGRDGRGAVFATGRLLRLLHMTQGKATLDASLQVATAPDYPIRAQQIGYRNAANSYDAWDAKQFEQYCRDLFVFGSNAIELIPSLDPQDKDKSPHMKLTMWDMTVKMSEVIGSYGMGVWIWLPLDEKIDKPGEGEKALDARRPLFKAMPNLDGVFVPGGDPGDTAPDLLMPWLKQLAGVLHESHPKAGVWVSNQGLEPDANKVFFDYLAKQPVDWLGGVIYGPWAKLTIQEMRANTPKQIAIRDYPDVTHSVRCQYPVPEWDRAFAHTLGRECVNPRPVEMTRIHALTAPCTVGFGTYSDGVNDDVNKVLWACLGWDGKADPKNTLRDYCGYFIGDAYRESAADRMFGFEEAWKGPVLKNQVIAKNFAYWKEVEKKADAKMLKENWRFQHALLRAYYDEYIRRRLAEATVREDNAMKALATAPKEGVSSAIASAKIALAKRDSDPEIETLRVRLRKLGEELFNSVGMQLDVASYGAAGAERGAVLEFLDQPLNNRDWLRAEFKTILSGTPPDQALKRLDRIVNWENPGPGGFYDDLGNAEKQPHLVKGAQWADDPGGVVSAQEEFSNLKDARLSWEDQAKTLYGKPLTMRYEGLDPKAQYLVRVTYAGRFKPTMRLVANGATEIHGPVGQPDPVAPLEYPVPKSATASGKLELSWQLVAGRGCQVAEVWLIKQ